MNIKEFSRFFQEQKVHDFLNRLKDSLIRKELFTKSLFYFFKEFKISNPRYWGIYEKFTNCGTWLKADLVSHKGQVKKKITSANFCNYYRFCEVCARRYRFKFLARWKKRVSFFKKFSKVHWYFKTVTVPHTKEDLLSNKMGEVDLISKEILKRKNKFWESVYRKYEIGKREFASFSNEDIYKLVDLNVSYFGEFNKLLKSKTLYIDLEKRGFKLRNTHVGLNYFKFFKKTDFKFRETDKLDLYQKYMLIDFNSLVLSYYLEGYSRYKVNVEEVKGYNPEFMLVGGLTTFEVTYSGKNGYHPHYHELCYSYKQMVWEPCRREDGVKIVNSCKTLSALASEILGIKKLPYTKITPVKDRELKLIEALKYMSKFTSLTGGAFVEVFRVLIDFRTLRSYGGLYGITDGVEDDKEVGGDISETFSLEEIEENEKVLRSVYIGYGKHQSKQGAYFIGGWSIYKDHHSKLNSS